MARPRTTPGPAPAPGPPPFTVGQEVAIDALDEWMGFASLPLVFEAKPELRDLMSNGRTLHFRATDTAPETAAEWLVGLDGDTLTWSRTHGRATVAVRAPLAELLLLVYGRRTTHDARTTGSGNNSRSGNGNGGSNGIQIDGDVSLLDAWLDGVSFWLKE
ncbi:hypothetical protein [Streptomyces nigrescens]